MKVILAGGGGAARELLRRLGESWEVAVVDSSSEALSCLSTIRPVLTVHGDASSRLVLEHAGLSEADALVAVTNNDEVNLEACRLAQAAGVLRVVAVAAQAERLPSYRELDVPVFSPDSLVARRVELQLEHRRITSMAFAEGRAEAIEFRIANDSPVRGKPLRDLHAESWIVGAVLRANSLIIPHGNTVLEEGDLVTVVGHGASFSEIVRTFTTGQARFPLDYGKRVAVPVDSEDDVNQLVAEASYLVRNSGATSLLLVHRDPKFLRDEDQAARIDTLLLQASQMAGDVEVRYRAVRESPFRALQRLGKEESVGAVVVRTQIGKRLVGRWQARRTVRMARQFKVPILMARGTFPYTRIVTPARRTAAGQVAVRAAIDLARLTRANLIGMAVIDPLFVAGPGAPLRAKQEIGWLKQEASMQQVGVTGRIRRGNLVRAFLESESESDLVVLGVDHASPNLSHADIASHVAFRARHSILIVPVLES
ncbi:MAG: NAD-binding protein [Acidobacteriota bacterium]